MQDAYFIFLLFFFISDDAALQNVSHVLLSRFLAFCGHVAVCYDYYLKVDYFAYLRRQEALREKRRRRSSLHAHVSSLHSNSFMSPPSKVSNFL